MEAREFYRNAGGEIKEFEKFSGDVGVGYKIRYKKKIKEIDVQLFGLVSGDFSPLHFDQEVAKKTKFGERVVHGMLTTSLISAALARIPGLVVILETYFRYVSPVRIGDEVVVEGNIIEADTERSRYKIEIMCSIGNRKAVEGWAKIIIW